MRRARTAPLSCLLVLAAVLQAAFVLAMPVRAAGLDPISTALIKVNQFRTEHGLLPVTLDARLSAAALRHARAMAEKDFFGHVGADGSQMGSRVTDAGYVWRLVAENIAAGMADPQTAVQTWIDSPGHRHNLLLKGVINAGFGHVHIDPDPGSVRYKDYWVLVLAAPQPGR